MMLTVCNALLVRSFQNNKFRVYFCLQCSQSRHSSHRYSRALSCKFWRRSLCHLLLGVRRNTYINQIQGFIGRIWAHSRYAVCPFAMGHPFANRCQNARWTSQYTVF